jgi:hypothetical protein
VRVAGLKRGRRHYSGRRLCGFFSIGALAGVSAVSRVEAVVGVGAVVGSGAAVGLVRWSAWR